MTWKPIKFKGKTIYRYFNWDEKFFKQQKTFWLFNPLL